MKLQVLLFVLCALIKISQCVSFQTIPWGVPQRKSVNRIVGAEYAIAQHFPWHAAIFHKIDRTWKYQCGGSLISDRFVLTAKHCTMESTDRLPVNRILVKFGFQKYTEENGNSQNRAVSKVYHAKGNLWEHLKNDIALVELEIKVEISEHVLPVLLVQEELLAGTTGTVIGFGYTEENELSEELKKLKMPIIDHHHCVLDMGQFCAGYADNRTACQGDSGNGLVFKKNLKFYLGGLVAYSEKQRESDMCRLKGYYVFTSVYNYLPWINRITKLNVPLGKPFNNIPCGVSKIKRFRRIVGGQETIPGQWPWHANIYHTIEKRKEFACGGALINDRFILTARHCVRDQNNFETIVNVTRILVQLGVHKLDDSSRHFYDLKKIYTPPTEVDDMPEIDVALLELSNEVVIIYTDIVRPVCLPVTDVEIGSYGTAIGFGYKEDDELAQTLRMAKMPVIQPLTCIRQLRTSCYFLSENSFCAGYSNGTTICNGDTGGGIYFKGVDDAWQIGGISSFSEKRDTFSYLCALDKPTVFTTVFKIGPWIKYVTASNFW